MKQWILPLLLLFFINNAFSQLGIKAGFNQSRISSSDEHIENIHGRLHYQMGLMLDVELIRILTLRSELILTSKGAAYTYKGAAVSNKMTYLDIPIVMKIHEKGLPLSFHFGPQISFLLQDKVSYNNGFLENNNSFSKDHDHFQSIDLGAVVGLAMEFEKSFIEMRFNRSFINFEKSTVYKNTMIDPSAKHWSLQASYGVFF